jgi:hypothetical protein
MFDYRPEIFAFARDFNITFGNKQDEQDLRMAYGASHRTGEVRGRG